MGNLESPVDVFIKVYDIFIGYYSCIVCFIHNMDKLNLTGLALKYPYCVNFNLPYRDFELATILSLIDTQIDSARHFQKKGC